MSDCNTGAKFPVSLLLPRIPELVEGLLSFFWVLQEKEGSPSTSSGTRRWKMTSGVQTPTPVSLSLSKGYFPSWPLSKKIAQ
jgi:hypothetical protein